MNEVLIAGIDSGKNVGIVLMNFDKKILLIKTLRSPSIGKIIDTIEKGKVLVIATDVSRCPSLIKKISSQMGTKIFTPRKSLTREEKEKLTRKYSILLKNKHERDALAACIKALEKYRRMRERIGKKLKEKRLKKFTNEIFEKIVFGEVENIKEGIRRVV
jgi:predicted RNase H-like nuclease (RuvC/YqgF family)